MFISHPVAFFAAITVTIVTVACMAFIIGFNSPDAWEDMQAKRKKGRSPSTKEAAQSEKNDLIGRCYFRRKQIIRAEARILLLDSVIAHFERFEEKKPGNVQPHLRSVA
jgi:hypothetical protein